MTSEYNDSMVNELEAFFIQRVGETENTLLKVINGVVNGGHFEFATAQAAVDFGQTNGYYHVYFPAGTYDNISITTNGMTISGASQRETVFSDTASHCIYINANLVSILNCRVLGTAGGGNNYDGIHVPNGNSLATVFNVALNGADRYGIYCDGDQCKFTSIYFAVGSIDSDDVRFDTNSSENVLDSSVNQDGTYTDNGTGNIKGDVT